MRSGVRARSRVPGLSEVVAVVATMALLLPAAGAAAQEADPREGLEAGFSDAGQASRNMELVAHVDKPVGFFDPADPGSSTFRNSDLAFTGDHVIGGNYNGFLIYDVSEPAEAEVRTAVVCPGQQGDVSVYGDLLFVSVQSSGTLDCTTLEEGEQAFAGVRVFDISDLDAPQQVAAVQTCRGSHTHTVVEDPDNDEAVYLYVSGTSGVREDDPAGLDCVVGPTVENADGEQVPSNSPDDFIDENGNPVETDRFQIEIIEVPLAAPQDAQVVAEPRVFASEDGNPFGLFPGSESDEDSPGTATTDSCHDITAFPEVGLAAGACEGNGLLFDITDPLAPQRVEAVTDPNFAYWHSATFNNDGTKVVFTDELGGGVTPTCLPEVPDNWGANAIFDIVEGPDGTPQLEFASYYKLPAEQTELENCVAHNGSLVPIPGRDIMVQAWYQGGISVMDFTDSENPREIAFFDRGPAGEDELVQAGYWSAYYYNGYIYGSERGRGFDVLRLTPGEGLSAEELEQAAAVRLDQFNPQAQSRITDADRSACGDVAPVDFPDVAGSVHAGNIGCVAGFGIAEGLDDGSYGPAGDVRRDQMASFLQRMLRVAGVELPESPADAFADDDDKVHAQAINQLAELGVVEGTGDGYNPSGTVSRAQMASFVVRSVETVLGEELPAPRSPFTDVAPGVHAASIDAAFAADIVDGVSQSSYQPAAAVQRGQMASFLARSLDVLRSDGASLTALSDG